MAKLVAFLVLCVVLMSSENSLASNSGWLIDTGDCGVTKGCFRVPDKCNSSLDCTYFLTWQKLSANEVHLEYAAYFKNHTQPPWSGFGIADAPKMSGASVVDCIVDSSGNVTIQMSSNIVDDIHHDNKRLNDTYLGLVRNSLQGSVVDSHIFCNFTRLRVITDQSRDISKVKNLTQPYYVLFATGPTDGQGKKDIHDLDFISNNPFASKMKIDFDVYSDFGDSAKKNPYIRAHATLMIFAWIVLASLGMFTSRYMKNQWNESGTVCGKPLWFQAHRYSMVLVIVLTLAGMLTIFAYKKWQFIVPDVQASVSTIHPTLGITVGALLLVNVFAGILRPNIYSPYRIYFWFLHTFVGHTSHLLAAVTMYLGVIQYNAAMPYWTKWVVVGFACWRVLADVVMTYIRIRYKEQPANYVAMANNEIDEPATKVAAWRCSVMIVYSIGVVLLALTLIVAANLED